MTSGGVKYEIEEGGKIFSEPDPPTPPRTRAERGVEVIGEGVGGFCFVCGLLGSLEVWMRAQKTALRVLVGGWCCLS